MKQIARRLINLSWMGGAGYDLKSFIPPLEEMALVPDTRLNEDKK